MVNVCTTELPLLHGSGPEIVPFHVPVTSATATDDRKNRTRTQPARRLIILGIPLAEFGGTKILVPTDFVKGASEA